jgi:hypothetical protein
MALDWPGVALDKTATGCMPGLLARPRIRTIAALQAVYHKTEPMRNSYSASFGGRIRYTAMFASPCIRVHA